MPNLTNATRNTRIVGERFEYYLSDLDCRYCANFRKRGGHGCGRRSANFRTCATSA
jgi:hypothetical protein